MTHDRSTKLNNVLSSVSDHRTRRQEHENRKNGKKSLEDMLKGHPEFEMLKNCLNGKK